MCKKGVLLIITLVIYSQSLFAQAPVINSFTPTNGCAGTVVNITGTNFTNVTAVKFDTINAVSFTVNSDTSITATVGSGATGVISVTTTSGNAISTDSFFLGNKITVAYVFGNTGLNIINTSNNTIISKQAIAGGPGVCLSPDGGTFYYVGNFYTLNFFNTSADLITGGVVLDPFSAGIAVSPDGTKVYVILSYSENILDVIDVATKTIIATIPVVNSPYQICVSNDGSKIYVSGAQSIAVIDAATNTVTGTLSIPAAGFCVSPDGSKLYIANNSDSTITVVNTSTNTISNKIAFAKAGFGSICISPDGNKIYVADSVYHNKGDNGSITIINTATNTITDSIALGFAVNNLNISKDGSHLYLTSTDNFGGVINTATNILTRLTSLSPTQDFGNFITDGFSSTCNTCTPTFSDTSITTCYSYLWNGINYTKSGDYLYHSINVQGCDSTATLHLTINNSTTASVTIATCDKFIWRGITYSLSGNYIDTITNTNGCDSIITLYLTISPVDSCSYSCVPTSSDTTVSACNSYTWKGTTYSKSGAYNYYTTNAGGCDSVVTLYLNLFTTNSYLLDEYYNNGEYYNSILYINTFTNVVTDSMKLTDAADPFLPNATGICSSPDGSKLYVLVNYPDLIVDVINTSSKTIIAALDLGQPASNLGQSVGEICISPDGSKVYVTSQFGNSVSVIDCATNTIIAAVGVSIAPGAICVSPDGSKVYVVNQNSSNISVINAATNIVTSTIPTGINPFGICISPDGKKLYVINSTSLNGAPIVILSVIDIQSQAILATIPVGTFPVYICSSLDGGKLYVSNSGSINFINTSTDSVIATLPVGGPIFVSPDGSKLYVLSNGISVINTSTNQIIPTSLSSSAGFSLSFDKTGNTCNSCMPTFSDTIVSACYNYTWNGDMYTTSGTYSLYFTNNSGCDSTANLFLTINTITNLDTPCSFPVSLKLLSFSAKKQDDFNNILQWQTANEINSAYFNIQRSKDGIKFITIGKTIAGYVTYSYIDSLGNNAILNSTTIYYRLQMVDKDGSSSYSNIVSILPGNNSATFGIYPNPAKDILYIKGKGINTVTIIDNTGRVVIEENKITRINIQNLSQGFYIVRISDNSGNMYTKKLIIE